MHGAKHTSEEAQIICNWQDCIQKLIDKFEHQADGFILHQHNLDIPNLSLIHDYNEYDNAALPEGLSDPDAQPSGCSTHCSSRGTLDGSGMNDTSTAFMACSILDTCGTNPCKHLQGPWLDICAVDCAVFVPHKPEVKVIVTNLLMISECLK
jgi:hypothetical protein